MVMCKWSNADVATVKCTHTHANAVEEATVVLEEMDQVLVESGEIQSKAEMTG